MNKRNGVTAAVSLLTALAACVRPATVFADTTTTASETTSAVSSDTTASQTSSQTETTAVSTELTTAAPATVTTAPHQQIFTDPASRIQYEILPDNTLRLTEFRWETDELEVQIPPQIDGKNITVTIHSDGSLEVEDQGRGVPYNYNAKEKLNGFQIVYQNHLISLKSASWKKNLLRPCKNP